MEMKCNTFSFIIWNGKRENAFPSNSSMVYLHATNYFGHVFVQQPLGYQVRKENWIYFEQYRVMHVQKTLVHTQAYSVAYSNKNRIHVVMLMQPLVPYLNSNNTKCLICVVNCAVRMFFVPKMVTVEPNIY